ncbi:MAG TPA: hypothetical protein VH501_10490, partial [Solirubrobacterales bacterium]
MEGRLPPDDDDLFEWTDAPAHPPRRERGGGTSQGSGDDQSDRPATGLGETEERRRVRRGDTGSFEAIREGIAERRREREETGEFERSGRPPPPGRRGRHRDLPARVRRRQA